MRSVAYYANDLRRENASGLTTYVRSIRDALTARDVTVRVMTRHADPGDPSAEILRPLRGLRRASVLSTRLSRGRIAPFEESVLIARHALSLARRGTELFEIEEHWGLAELLVRVPMPAPVVVRAHGPHFLVCQASQAPWDRHAEHMDRRERDTALRAFALTVPSRDTLRRLREHWRHELPHARVIPNSSPTLPPDQCWMGRSDGPIVFVGRTERLKGIDLVIRAFRSVAQRDRTRELWLVGPEVELREDGRCYPRVADFLRDTLPDLAMRKRVRVLGAKPPDEVNALRRGASCVVVASRFETFCLAAVEAMMAGCPLLAPNDSALPELVRDGVTGLLFQSGDADDLARAIEIVLRNPGYAAELGQRARIEAMQHFSQQVVVEDTLRFYAETLHAARAAPARLTWLRKGWAL